MSMRDDDAVQQGAVITCLYHTHAFIQHTSQYTSLSRFHFSCYHLCNLLSRNKLQIANPKVIHCCYFLANKVDCSQILVEVVAVAVVVLEVAESNVQVVVAVDIACHK